MKSLVSGSLLSRPLVPTPAIFYSARNVSPSQMVAYKLHNKRLNSCSTHFHARRKGHGIVCPVLKLPKCFDACRGVCDGLAESKYRGDVQCIEILQDVLHGLHTEHPSKEVLESLSSVPLEELTSTAAAVRDKRPDSNIVTFSPKVFIPLTRLCRDACAYCTFAVSPRDGQRCYMSPDEVLAIAKEGEAAGCTEALFTLGDKPELRYPQAKSELDAMGMKTTLEYVHHAALLVLQHTTLLPHINAGVMTQSELTALRQVSASQGLMLESTSERLLEPGFAHHGCPDKIPAARLATIEAAGKARVPFTSGLLIGIGETRHERLQALLALRSLHSRYGHIQEVIVQSFRAKVGTVMGGAAEPPLEELLWTVAMARLAFGPSMNIQAPPNLTPSSKERGDFKEWKALIGAGINDWGGISSVTRDWVNPEAAWPHLPVLAQGTAGSGKQLVPRLPVYPAFVDALAPSLWLAEEEGVAAQVLAQADSLGYARACAHAWAPGSRAPPPPLPSALRFPRGGAGGGLVLRPAQEEGQVAVGSDGLLSFPTPHGVHEGEEEKVEEKAEALVARIVRLAAGGGPPLPEAEIEQMFCARGAQLSMLCLAADKLRRLTCGPKVTYVVNRNINYTNVCTYGCKFCAFSKGPAAEQLRGKAYRLDEGEVARRAAEAWERGATEVCMQGGIHPDFTGRTYLSLLRAVKEAAPALHVHAFSPLEVQQGARTLGLRVEEYLERLRDAGLGSLPGTAAEVLHDDVRRRLCPDKLSSQEWLQVVEAAHRVGLRTTSTIMFGHLDHPSHWARHLVSLRDLQQATGGITEQAPIFVKGHARRGPTMRECLLMHAVARLVLHPFICNIQASWVKMGPGGAQALLGVGCNDMGGSLMNESITRAAGASHGEELSPREMEALISSMEGRLPEQRTTLYGAPPPAQVARSFAAPDLIPVR
eukprot:jgi/Mesen1/1918/ME000144S01045